MTDLNDVFRVVGEGESDTPSKQMGRRPSQTNAIDRRDARRFPLETEVHWRGVGARDKISPGRGRSINMSSNGVLFTTARPLRVGSRVELSIHWPVSLDDVCPLKLVMQGRITRAAEKAAAITFDRYEFRTRAHRDHDGAIEEV